MTAKPSEVYVRRARGGFIVTYSTEHEARPRSLAELQQGLVQGIAGAAQVVTMKREAVCADSAALLLLLDELLGEPS